MIGLRCYEMVNCGYKTSERIKVEELIRMMVGREVVRFVSYTIGEEVLRVEN